jgi:hypothetical protein
MRLLTIVATRPKMANEHQNEQQTQRDTRGEFQKQLSTEEEYISSVSNCNSEASSKAQYIGAQWRTDPASNLVED